MGVRGNAWVCREMEGCKLKVKQLMSWNYSLCLGFIADQAALLGRENQAGQESKCGMGGCQRKAGGREMGEGGLCWRPGCKAGMEDTGQA